MMNISNQSGSTKKPVVFITGSTRGIGYAMAQVFAGRGYIPVLNGRRKDEKALAALQVIQRTAPEAVLLDGSVDQAEQVQTMFDEIMERYGRLDVLINNAGMTRDKLMLKMSEEDFTTIVDVNLKGAFLCSRAAIKPMMKARKGAIINISSITGLHGNAGQANYAASKAGLIGLSKSMAKELASRNIRVNVIAPGWIETDMTAQVDADARHRLVSQIPLKRPGNAQDVASLALFLADDASSYITGQVIGVDGGLGM